MVCLSRAEGPARLREPPHCAAGVRGKPGDRVLTRAARLRKQLRSPDGDGAEAGCSWVICRAGVPGAARGTAPLCCEVREEAEDRLLTRAAR